MRRVLAVVLILLALLLFANPFFMVRQERQVVVVQFGKPVKVITEPGLKLRVPFIQQIRVFSKKLLDYDSDPDEVISRDKRTLVLDSYAKWRIVDPLTFLTSLGTAENALTTLDDILYSVIRERIGQHEFHEIITDRHTIMEGITVEADRSASQYGVEIVDVHLKRVDLPAENEKAVFERMGSERQRIAAKYQSEGMAEGQKIRAQTDRQVAELLASARREAEEIRGEGEAEATRIYAEAYSADQEFYEFWMALNTLRESLESGETTVIIPNESPLARYLLGYSR